MASFCVSMLRPKESGQVVAKPFFFDFASLFFCHSAPVPLPLQPEKKAF